MLWDKWENELLIQSCPTDSYQNVICSDDSSTWKSVQCGVPQGSIYGPLLFVIYINDLPYKISNKYITMLLYADDTIIIITESSYTATKHQATSLLTT